MGRFGRGGEDHQAACSVEQQRLTGGNDLGRQAGSQDRRNAALAGEYGPMACLLYTSRCV